MADRPNPYVRKDPGDIIRSGDWNELQVRAREEVRSHRHSGGDDGLSIPRAGIEEKAIDGSRIDPTAEVNLKNLTLSGDLKVSGKLTLGDVDDLLPRFKSLESDKLNRAGDTITGSLSVKQTLSVNSSIGVGIDKPDAKLQIIHTPQDANGNALIVGPINGSNLRLGNHTDYSWVQSHKSTPLAINPLGNNVGIGTVNPQAKLEVAGVVRAQTFEATNPLRHRMYPDNPLVYQDIFDAKAKGAITKIGNPQYDETTHSSVLWNQRRLIRFGSSNEADGNGAQVIVPAGYDTVWIRVLGDRWTAVKAYFLDGAREDLGLWAGGYRAANCYCPDGSLSDGCFFVRDNANRTAHQWLPIPVRRAGSLALIVKPNTTEDFWLSGLAFSKNPWTHAAQSAVTYHWALNGGDGVKWNNHDWNGDVLAEIVKQTNWELRVPVIPSGRDKLLYLVEHNNNWNGCMHAGITVNGQAIERFISTYDNPFARHWNNKFYERYIAARIPAGLIPADTRWLSVRIDMSTQGNSIYFREIGTHDLDIPWS